VEHPGGEDGDAELLAQWQELAGAGPVEQGVPAGEQDAVRSGRAGLTEEPGRDVRVVHPE
jgi:hypothetical protein